MTLDDVEGAPVEVWPENWPAWTLFLRLTTQWRTGFAGRTGLDYSVMFQMMDRMGLQSDEYDQLEDDVRVLELEALATMHETKD